MGRIEGLQIYRNILSHATQTCGSEGPLLSQKCQDCTLWEGGSIAAAKEATYFGMNAILMATGCVCIYVESPDMCHCR